MTIARSDFVGRIIAAIVCLALAMMGLAGCSLRPDPPAGLEAVAADLAGNVRALPGVHSASATVEDVDFKDKPGQWYVYLIVAADSAAGLETVPAQLTPLIAEVQNAGHSVRFVLQIPEGAGLAWTSLSSISSGVAQTAAVLRAIPGVRSVDGNSYRPDLSVNLDDSMSLNEIVPALRSALANGGNAVPVVRANFDEMSGAANVGSYRLIVDLTATWPTAEMLRAIEDLEQLKSVDSLWADAADVARSASIRVDVTNPSEAPLVISSLTAVSDGDRLDPTVFTIYGPDGEQLHRGVTG